MQHSCQPSTAQIRILVLCAQGHTREEIGRELCISPWTVKTHLDALRAELGARNITHAVAICVVTGHLLVDPLTKKISSPEVELAHAA